MNEVKNKNLFIRVSQKEKNIIELNAEKCGLSVSEYLRQRVLGYMPRAVLPEVFFSFNLKNFSIFYVFSPSIVYKTMWIL